MRCNQCAKFPFCKNITEKEENNCSYFINIVNTHLKSIDLKLNEAEGEQQKI